MQEQNFLRMYKAQQSLPVFNEIYKGVESCTIIYTRTADSPGGKYSDPKPLIKHISASESSMVTIECINTDCTKGYFDLRSEIDDMVYRHEEKRTGVMFCDGNLEKDSGYQCRCKLEYEIQIEYK